MTVTTSGEFLETLQRWMLTVISHPSGVQAGVASDQAQQQIDISPDQLDTVVAPSQRLTSCERMQIYANAYYGRLIECLREEFPTLVHVLGESNFDAFAFAYLESFPPRSYTLARLGARFPEFMQQTRPSAGLPEDGPPSWPDFLIDLARVERIYSEVFDGPGIERQRILQADDLLEIAPGEWPHAQLIAVPCLRLLSLRYPVHECISAVRRGAEPDVPDASPTYLAVTRRDYVVRRCQLTATEYDLLSALVAGQSVGEAIEQVARFNEGEWQSLQSNLQNWFKAWARAAFFQAVEVVPRPSK